MDSNFHIKSVSERMNSSGLSLPKIYPIRVSNEKATWITPSLDHIFIIPTFWTILHNIVRDWEEAALKYPFPPDLNTGERINYEMYAFDELEPQYIQCLFSYINFYFTLENGLNIFYDELKRLHYELGLSEKMPKKPKRDLYIDKLWRVRVFTVVHWGGPDKKHKLNSIAGRSWGLAYKNDVNNLIDLEFGYSSVVGAEDRVLKPIKETHEICTNHIIKLDEACASIMLKITSYLPLTIKGNKYEWLKPEIKKITS